MEILGFDLSAIDLEAWWRAVGDFVTPRLAPTLGILAVAGGAYVVARAVFTRIQKRWVTRTANRLDDSLILLLRQVLLLSIVAWAVWRLLDTWSLPQAAEWAVAAWIGLLFVPLSRFVSDMLGVVEERLVERTPTTLDDTALPLLNTALRFLVIALGVVLALDRLGLNIAPLLAGAGVMGLALSLAAKDTLSNLIAGVLLIMDRPFQVGDRIELWTAPNETGTWGDVIEIGLRATKIRNPDNLVMVVPNNEIMRRDIVNYTMSGAHIRLRIPFSISYESDVEAAKRLLIEIARETGGVKLDPPPVVIVRGFGPSEVNLQLRVWILEARSRRRIADGITERALAAFGEAGLEIPYPKRDIYVRYPEGPAAEDPVAGHG